ncbi:MAG: hypothetical protein UT23_C0005G0016 [Candidatus Woesebacteria bacterium GW2011_GWA1_39_12]|uniref:Uncharacterized protein n=1 Tax=Candidatus Woesebacteria bacterium GW2011_GWA1_39_12 TaxID=1618549 RepID=A0A0G0M1N2_9BACT|nr:MAG: hypothetical protein UT23_C0005G0016 [Candidatus Woesebacteria bacterium GW2011_GWA1_39_12]
MIPYHTHVSKLAGTRSYKDIYRNALAVYSQVKRKTKRQPYARSAYFNKQKIFFTFFWKHLFDYSHKVRIERLKYFEATLDLIKNSKNAPESKDNPNNIDEILHRFAGLTKEKELFMVQIKENKRTGKKFLMSIFPFK